MRIITPRDKLTPASAYRLWIPGMQAAGSGAPVDRSGKANDLALASPISSIVPWSSVGATPALGALCVPTPENGYIYECTTSGAKGGSQPSFGTTVGATTADSSAVWTCRRGVWSDSGWFRSLLSSQGVSLNNAESGFSVAANQSSAYVLTAPHAVGRFDLAGGESMILSVRIKQNYSGSTENFLMGNRPSGAAGWSLVAVPDNGSTTKRTIRFRLSNNVVQTFTTDYPTVTFETLDGNEHHLVIFVDGITKLLYGYVDGNIVNAVGSGTITMNAANIAAVLTNVASSTVNATAPNFQIGIQPGTTNASVAYLMRDLHLLVVPSGGLPANKMRIVRKLLRQPFTPLTELDIAA